MQSGWKKIFIYALIGLNYSESGTFLEVPWFVLIIKNNKTPLKFLQYAISGVENLESGGDFRVLILRGSIRTWSICIKYINSSINRTKLMALSSTSMREAFSQRSIALLKESSFAQQIYETKKMKTGFVHVAHWLCGLQFQTRPPSSSSRKSRKCPFPTSNWATVRRQIIRAEATMRRRMKIRCRWKAASRSRHKKWIAQTLTLNSTSTLGMEIKLRKSWFWLINFKTKQPSLNYVISLSMKLPNCLKKSIYKNQDFNYT